VVDAAVAVSFALGVAEPDASGVGGYGQMLVLLKGMDEPALIEFMTRVPEDASLSNASLNPGGDYPDDGPVLANVPGTVAGMYEAWKRFGSRAVPWGDLLAPAIRAAKQGVPVSDGFATTLRRERSAFLKYEGSRALFFPDGEPLAAGDTLRNPDLAWVLERIAADSADGFYRGEVARRLVQDLRGQGNAMRLTDLARYFAAEREPVSTTFRGYTVFSSAPPVSGGASLAAKLNLLEQTPRPGEPYSESAAALHAMIAAWQLVPSSRGRIGDPSLWPVDIAPFVSKDTARARWQCFDASKALTPELLQGSTLRCAGTTPVGAPAGSGLTRQIGAASALDGRDAGTDAAAVDEGAVASLSIGRAAATAADGNVIDPSRPCDVGEHAEGVRVCRSHGTTAFVVGDADGNVVAVTQTLGTWGGNFYVTPGLGFLYNDKLTSYGSDPDSYGARLPYARHGSTIAPTIVTRGDGAERRPVLAVGAAGNAWITSAVYQTLVGVLDDGLSAQQALELPRFLPGTRGSGAERAFEISIESGVNPDVLRALERMGYHFDVISLPGELRMGYGAAITFGDGSVTAGADPRRSGAAAAVP
jgi:gamma-glutamyltranspeptidase